MSGSGAEADTEGQDTTQEVGAANGGRGDASSSFNLKPSAGATAPPELSTLVNVPLVVIISVLHQVKFKTFLMSGSCNSCTLLMKVYCFQTCVLYN